VRAYDGYGYFPPAELEEVVARVRATDVTVPPRILGAFVRRYARD